MTYVVVATDCDLCGGFPAFPRLLCDTTDDILIELVVYNLCEACGLSNKDKRIGEVDLDGE